MAAPVRKSREASEAAQTGWSLTETASVNDHPVRSVKEASQHLLDVASTPPHEEGNLAHCDQQLIHVHHLQARTRTAATLPGFFTPATDQGHSQDVHIQN